MKTYPIVAHAIHSRLQLVRNRLDIQFDMNPADLVNVNQKLFEKAAESAKTHHNLNSSRSELYAAAELFLATIDSDDYRVKVQPMWQPKAHADQNFIVEMLDKSTNTWRPVSTGIISLGMFGDGKPMTLERANEIMWEKSKRHPTEFFRISHHVKKSD